MKRFIPHESWFKDIIPPLEDITRDEETLVLDVNTDELIIDDYNGSEIYLRELLYKYNYILYNRESDGRLYFVKQHILEEIYNILSSNNNYTPDCPYTSSMNYTELTRIEQLLHDPLHYNMKSSNYKRPTTMTPIQ